MSMIHRSRTAVSVFVTVLTFAFSTPFAVHADEQIIAEEQVLAAEEQDPALAPAGPSWDETSGYGSVEANRAAAHVHLAPIVGPSWDETSGYGSVEAVRANIGHDYEVSGDAATGHEASAAVGLSWDDTSGYGSVEASRAAASALLAPVAAPSTCIDYIPAALASGRRAESAHLATVPLPGEVAVSGPFTDC
jgi:hypothetical protein